jgi:hypothetical protein
MNKDINPVSRADLAQVIASALLEPNACKAVRKKQAGTLSIILRFRFKIYMRRLIAPFQLMALLVGR